MFRVTWKQAVALMASGEVVAAPTETIYGLFCDPRQQKAVHKVFAMKGRDAKKALPLVAGSSAQVKRLVVWNRVADALAKKHWPGPLTMVLPLRNKARLAYGVAAKKEIAIRVSGSSDVRSLCRAVGFPLVATSANRSGESVARSAKEIEKIFGQTIFVVDGGHLPKRKPSTILRIKKNSGMELLRSGALCEMHERRIRRER